MTTGNNVRQLPPLPSPGEVLSKWAYDEHDMQAYAIAALEQQRQIEAQASVVKSEPVAQWKRDTSDEIPMFDVGAPTTYEQSIGWEPLYTHPAQCLVIELLHEDIQSVLFEVEEAIKNGCCPWQIEAAFEAYEAACRLQQPAHGIQGS